MEKELSRNDEKRRKGWRYEERNELGGGEMRYSESIRIAECGLRHTGLSAYGMMPTDWEMGRSSVVSVWLLVYFPQFSPGAHFFSTRSKGKDELLGWLAGR